MSTQIYAALLPRIGRLEVALDNKESLVVLYQLFSAMDPHIINIEVCVYNRYMYARHTSSLSYSICGTTTCLYHVHIIHVSSLEIVYLLLGSSWSSLKAAVTENTQSASTMVEHHLHHLSTHDHHLSREHLSTRHTVCYIHHNFSIQIHFIL